MDAYERLREAYAQDLIDLDEFETAVEAMLQGRTYALPAVWQVPDSERDRRQRQRETIRRVAIRSRPQHTANVASVLKAAWTESHVQRHDWGDGKGRVHAISLDEHEKNLRIRQLMYAAAKKRAV